MATTAFGNILVASELEDSVVLLLRKWFPTYLREVERQVNWDREELLTPRQYSTRNSFDVLAGEEMPKVVVINPGLFQLPTHPESDGSYRAMWQIAVGVAIAAKDEEIGNRMVKMYGAAIRAIMAQHQSLERDDVLRIDWIDEGYEDLDITDQLMLYKAAAVYFSVEAQHVVSRWAAPPEPSEHPVYIKEVELVEITINEDKVSGQAVTGDKIKVVEDESVLIA